ncbi:MAG: hypothetical protein RMI79_06910, partial [Nitrososphaerota archaeon]|nr:hypothetical protein [Nitrososphaerota archaeon]
MIGINIGSVLLIIKLIMDALEIVGTENLLRKCSSTSGLHTNAMVENTARILHIPLSIINGMYAGT